MTNTNSQADINAESSTALTNLLALPDAGTITTTSLQLPESMSVEQWRDVVVKIGQIGGAIPWWLGDWWVFGAEHQWNWGEGREAAEAAGINYQTVKQYGSVALAYKWCDRSHHLTFTHHLAAMRAPAKERKRWLRRAEKKGWSVAQLRDEIAEAKRIAELAPPKTDDEPGDDGEEDRRAPAEAPPEDDRPDPTPETGDEAKPDQAIDDESNTPPENEEHRQFQRQIEMEQIQADRENRKILCDLLRNQIQSEFLTKVTGAELFEYIPEYRRGEVFANFIDQFTVDAC
jgi:hypothetical protein